MQIVRNAIVAGALVLAAALPAAAQQDQSPAPSAEPSAPQGGMDQSADQGPGGMMGGMMKQGGMMPHCPKMGGRHGKRGHGMTPPSVPMMEGRLAYIKADLEITEAQTPAWNAYADAIRARRANMEEMHADMMKAKESGDVVQRMDARIKGLETALDG
ncbi:MAG: Spy/CpxP family protein refolding chaperone, partial [Methyloceanibacter sp.]